MGDPVEKFIHRATRYVLRPHDDKFVRFSIGKQTHLAQSTRFLNMSSTGLAFVTDMHQAPQVGEKIKIEFPVPGLQRMAWWATVTRIEFYKPIRSWYLKKEEGLFPNEVVVGITYHNLPAQYERQIAKSLEGKFIEILQKERRQYIEGFKEYAKENIGHFLLFIALSICTVYTLHWLSQPIYNYDNYDSQHGTPWGERFKLFD